MDAILMNPVNDGEHPAESQFRPIRRLDSAQIERVCDAMRARLHQGVRLSAVASLIGLSPSHFSRCFHKSIGPTFTASALRLRIEESMRLMVDTDWTLCEIALASGFGDQSMFSRSFARAVGMAPLKWRVLNRER